MTFKSVFPDTAGVCDVSDAGGEQSGSEFSGVLVISNGSVFTEELLDKHSAQFKALAYDCEQKVTHPKSRSAHLLLGQTRMTAAELPGVVTGVLLCGF